MATRGANPAMLGGLGKFAELRRRILFVIGALLVFRLGAHVPVPGINPLALAAMFDAQRGTVLDMFNMFSGGALERLSIFALGVMPYISASIIVQLLSSVVPKLEELKKEGAAGRRKLTQYTRYGTVVLAAFQALGIAIALEGQTARGMSVVIDPGLGFRVIAISTLVAGSMFLLWLGEQVTERGIGNGISLLIFAGIVAGLPGAFGGTLELVSTGEIAGAVVLLLIAVILAVTGFVVFVERGQRRITVNYAQRQQGRQMYAAQTSHLPLKINMAGVIPAIFASSILLFPSTLASWAGSGEGGLGWLRHVTTALSPGQPFYVLSYAAFIVFFCFFYTAVVFNPKDTADNLKRSGAFLPGVRPGEQTARYIDGVVTRLTAAGAIYIALVCLLPEFLIVYWHVPFYFGGTSLLIVVITIMDFMAQVQTHVMSHQYEGLLKKANLKGRGAGGLFGAR
ncbi:MAG TPA: preprotein translocase subunit SecY [Gammaproteobacteria bacterium]|uniref:preprotein translocase subunit SecY n=1 Tax=Immundisolibacter sp. TaxID=1934948 RepID=UPI000E9865DA|nr:preprotein translocase subunit SecY [Gammaproteobacteria bacterium]HCZ48929.1 preprotein translocase subunit SecY [Gammaproteobacteria bacterium]MCH78367.1 preprotein translocase subunit SecY [Gammaproteobacteria bacterium]